MGSQRFAVMVISLVSVNVLRALVALIRLVAESDNASRDQTTERALGARSAPAGPLGFHKLD